MLHVHYIHFLRMSKHKKAVLTIPIYFQYSKLSAIVKVNQKKHFNKSYKTLFNISEDISGKERKVKKKKYKSNHTENNLYTLYVSCEPPKKNFMKRAQSQPQDALKARTCLISSLGGHVNPQQITCHIEHNSLLDCTQGYLQSQMIKYLKLKSLNIFNKTLHRLLM